MSKPEPFDLIDADTYVDESPRDEVTSLRARVAKLEAALTKISTAARKDTSLVPEDPLLTFIVGVVDAALSETVEA